MQMAMYALSTQPLIQAPSIENDEVKQVWYADDSSQSDHWQAWKNGGNTGQSTKTFGAR